MQVVDVIATGSKPRNCVSLFDGEVVVDIGVLSNNKKLKTILPKIKYILLTHEHGDHTHIPTLRMVLGKRPSVKIIAGKHMKDYLDKHAPNEFDIEVLEVDKVYKYGDYLFSPFALSHDVPNVGWHIHFISDKKSNNLKDKTFKTIYVTDSGTYPNDLRAPNYHIYLLEINYLADMVMEQIEQEETLYAQQGQPTRKSHRRRSLVDHLGDEDTIPWWKKQGGGGVLIPLHMSEIYADAILDRYGTK